MENQRYYETVDVLVKAYLKDKLEFGDPCSCAIGNMIQAKGIEVTSLLDNWYVSIRSHGNNYIGNNQLNSLPYDRNEVNEIEHSFELNRHVDVDVNVNLLNGLQSVEQTIYEMEVWDEDLSVHEASERINKGTYELVLN